MDDDEFDDLFAEDEMLDDSSQESLICTAADLSSSTTEDEEIRLFDHADKSSTMLGSQEAKEMKTENLCERTEVVQHDSSSSTKPKQDYLRSTVVDKIDEMFQGFADALQSQGSELVIAMRTRTSPRNKSSSSGGSPCKADSTSLRRVCFPGKTAEEAWRFAIFIRVLELIYEALRTDVVLSKRDIYYRDPALFGKQANVDRCIDDIALIFDVPRASLNVSAVAKGLVAGAMTFCRRDGSIIDAAGDREGILVPTLRDILSVDMTKVRWIVVMEKEATFRSTASSSFWETILREGVIITGKGYPDIATRALLHFLSTPSPWNGFASPPVYGLVDLDPDGLAIFSIYKYGSLAHMHENETLRVPQLKWLGLKNEHMALGEGGVHAAQGLLNLTARDRTKAVKMLDREQFSASDHDDLAVMQALQTMLMLNVKAELQLLDVKSNGMQDLLTSMLDL